MNETRPTRLDAAGRRHQRGSISGKELGRGARRGALVRRKFIERRGLERLRAELLPVEAAAEELRGLDRCPARRQRRRARREDDEPPRHFTPRCSKRVAQRSKGCPDALSEPRNASARPLTAARGAFFHATSRWIGRVLRFFTGSSRRRPVAEASAARVPGCGFRRSPSSCETTVSKQPHKERCGA